MEAYPDEVEMEDMVVDDEKQCQWRIQFGENEVGIDYNIVLLHNKRWYVLHSERCYVYMNEKRLFIKGGYYL